MALSESEEVALSQRDLPLWARGSAAGLMLFASWWLLSTEALRNALGDSIGLVSLGVVAIFILRGMRLPVGLWPDGPWRMRFSVPAVVGAAAVLAACILLFNPTGSDGLRARLDLGTSVAVVLGSVAWGFALALVRQRSFLGWYALAAGLALVPLLWSLIVANIGGGDEGFCLFSTQLGSGGSTEAGARCDAAAAPSLLFLLAIGVTSRLVTEEVAFRRLLIGGPGRVGLVSVVGAGVVALGWYGVLAWSSAEGSGTVLVGGLGALTAGGLYVLSGSLLVSAVHSATFAAGYSALSVARPLSAEPAGQIAAGPSLWVPALIIGVVLSALVARRNGLIGSVLRSERSNAPRD